MVTLGHYKLWPLLTLRKKQDPLYTKELLYRMAMFTSLHLNDTKEE